MLHKQLIVMDPIRDDAEVEEVELFKNVYKRGHGQLIPKLSAPHN
jgi:hypothetical protein